MTNVIIETGYSDGIAARMCVCVNRAAARICGFAPKLMGDRWAQSILIKSSEYVVLCYITYR